MKSVVALFVVAACGAASGTILNAMTLHNTVALNVLSELPVFSLNFPHPTPPNVVQVWRLTTRANAVIRLDCPTIELAETVDCSAASITLTGSRDGLTMCGANNNIFYRSDGPSMTVIFRSGALGGGRLNCRASARLMGPQGVEVYDLPTNYHAVPSTEVDSSEHGGPVGRKAPSCPCGQANKGNERIVGGKETGVNEFPFIAGVALRGARASFCGSSLITVSHAITAAHCTDLVQPGQLLSIIVGEHDQLVDDETTSTMYYNVAQIIQHQGYRPFSFINDISLLVTETPVQLTPNVGLVCVPTRRVDLTNEMVKIIGWGALAFKGVGSPVLRKVDVRVIPHLSCSYYWENVSFALQTQICTYGNQKASCQGDSGGPVVWVDPETNRYTLAGLVSYGAVCGDHMPSVHTDVFAFMPWINANIQATRPTALMCGNV